MAALPTRLSVVFDAALTDDFSEADISAALMAMLDSGDHAVALVLRSGVCCYANHAFHSLVGAAVDEAGLRPADDEVSVPPPLMDRLAGLSTDHPGPVTVRLTDYHGRHWQLSARSVSFPSGQPAIQYPGVGGHAKRARVAGTNPAGELGFTDGPAEPVRVPRAACLCIVRRPATRVDSERCISRHRPVQGDQRPARTSKPAIRCCGRCRSAGPSDARR